MSQAGWSDDRVNTLTLLWRDGQSASQIAKALGGVTRNAVIGKIHRLGLSGRPAPSRPARARAVRPARLPAAANPHRPKIAPVFLAAPATPEGPGVIGSLTALGAHTCRWPIGDPKAEDFSFCGRLAKGPYCPAHKTQAVRPGTAWRADRDPVVRRALAGLVWRGVRRGGEAAWEGLVGRGRPSGSNDLATIRRPPQGTLRSKPLWGSPPVGARRSRADGLPLKPDRTNTMSLLHPLPSDDRLTAYESQALELEDPRPYPQEDALAQLGHGLMNEVLDLVTETALEDVAGLVCEALIGAFHSAAQRIERDGDKARDALNGLVRDFDGSEILDVEIQDATRRARSADVATLALELIRDAAAASYTTATGDVWSPWKGSVKASRTTAAQIEARDAIRANKALRHAAACPGATVVAFRAAPQADTAEDAGRIFDALNWARSEWPDMALATSGARGGEKLAIKWAKQKGVTLVLAKADFDRNGRAAPFRANDEMLDLEPVCVLTLANSINPNRSEGMHPFGPAMNLAQKAMEKGIRHHPVKARA